MASIPHGVTVMMQGPNPGTRPAPGPPVISPLVPFVGYPGLVPFPPGPGFGIQPITTNGNEHVVPEVNIGSDVLAPGSQSTGPYPTRFQGFIDEPNEVLRDAIAGLDILGAIVINLTTDTQSVDGLPTLAVGSGL